MGEKLDVSRYTLKRLVNHSVSNDITGGYLVLDIERLRVHICRITSAFLDLLGIKEEELRNSVDMEPVEVIQLVTYGSSQYNLGIEDQTMAVKGKKEERIDARLTAEAKQQIDQAAALQGRSTSDFMVQAALKEASQVIEQQRIVRLTVEESVALAQLMNSEPKVNEASVAAMRRHNEIIGS